MATLAIKIPHITLEKFGEICQANQNLRLELSATGEIIAMPPTHSWTGRQNAGLIAQLWNWNEQKELGIVFDSSCGFTLPNGAVRSRSVPAASPDAAWIQKNRWNLLTPEQQRYQFSPIAPDLVVELGSNNDELEMLQAKMQEYMDNGVRLGWLIDPRSQQVEIYRTGQATEILRSQLEISGEDVMPEFKLNLNKIWA